MQASAEGRQKVRTHLWEVLDDAGVKPPLKVTQEKYDAMRKRLEVRLAYMTVEALDCLAQTVLSVIARGQGNRCLSEVLMRGYAQALQSPPFQQHPVVRSWLASIEGPRALAEGYAVALYRWLQLHAPPPPLPYDMRKIKDQAVTDARRVAVLRSRLERDVITNDERSELSLWERDTVAVREIIAEGQAARNAQAASDQDGAAA